MKTLDGKIVVVAGASRGAGRGIALAFGDAGATVYVAARSSRHGPPPADKAPGTVEDTAEQVTARGGHTWLKNTVSPTLTVASSRGLTRKLPSNPSLPKKAIGTT
jgi:NAD(P)-dependent dehydrogenase (short-subunit alcohol dehydrogenase family)